MHKRYYVYMHVDPVTYRIVYIGRGSGQRAFMTRSCKDNGPRYGHRSADHARWIVRQERKNFTMLDIVKIPRKQLSLKESVQEESKLILVYKPVFNKHVGPGSRLDKTKVRLAKRLRRQGLSFAAIASKMRISTMSAWRHVKHE